VSDWDSERVRALVAAAENAVQRTRWVFLVLNLGCAIMFTAQLNLYLPWVRNVHNRVVSRIKAEKTKAQQAGTEKLRAEAEAEAHDKGEFLTTINKVMWDDLYNVSLPLLGIKYSADDLIVLGTAAMSILALWFVYAHRRENHCIGVLRDITNDAKTKDRALASYIHAAIAHHFVFTTTTLNDEPYTMMHNKKPNSHGTKSVRRWHAIALAHLPWIASFSHGTKSVLRWHVIALTHLPWIASLTAVIVMCLSLFVSLDLALVPNPDNPSPLFFQMESGERIEAIGRMVWGLLFMSLTMFYCFRAQKFDRDTHMMLGEMENAASDVKPDKVGS
jgi:hypothetical protein